MKAYLWLVLAMVLLSGCGEVHEEHLVGPYDLSAIDLEQQMSVYHSDNAARIGETVFSVGWNKRYLVAKQHPNNNRSVTNFFYLDMTKDGPYFDPKASVVGPLTEAEFARKQAELGLPSFQRTITSLQ